MPATAIGDDEFTEGIEMIAGRDFSGEMNGEGRRLRGGAEYPCKEDEGGEGEGCEGEAKPAHAVECEGFSTIFKRAEDVGILLTVCCRTQRSCGNRREEVQTS